MGRVVAPRPPPCLCTRLRRHVSRSARGWHRFVPTAGGLAVTAMATATPLSRPPLALSRWRPLRYIFFT